MNKPLVSVVIPLFNKEDYIESTLQSVVNQSYTEIELIVIDDSSTDGSLQIVRSFLDSHTRRFRDVKINSRKNAGQAEARNEGISVAQGEFIAFLDADDVWHPKKIEKQVEYLLNHEIHDLVLCNYFMIFENSRKVNAVKLSPIRKKVTNWLLTIGYGGLVESTGLVRRASLVEMGGFHPDLQMCGGLDLVYRFGHKNSIGCLNDYLCGYRVTRGGWHNNKSDLVQSYEFLFTKSDLYGEYETKARKYLEIHLCIWFLRNRFSLRNTSRLLTQFLRNPILFSNYVSATMLRVFIASLRGIVQHEDSSMFRKAML